MAGILQGFEQTIAIQGRSLKITQEALEKARAEAIESGKNLTEVTAELQTKIVQLQSAETKQRQTLERMLHLQSQIKGVVGSDSNRHRIVPKGRRRNPASPRTQRSRLRTI